MYLLNYYIKIIATRFFSALQRMKKVVLTLLLDVLIPFNRQLETSIFSLGKEFAASSERNKSLLKNISIF